MAMTVSTLLLLLLLLPTTLHASSPTLISIPTVSPDSPPSTSSTSLHTLTTLPPPPSSTDPYSHWLHGLIPPTQPHFRPGHPRPPGTLLLNMLTKNEAAHLNRTLPLWAPLIDYYIIGIDDANTDDSPRIIQRHLGHIPGRIETVHFTGMGPTWTLLVEAGLRHFPEATHGIIADADFAPMQLKLDRMQLDVRCSKAMYTVYTEDHLTTRRMDWIYRNLRGVRVERRTHQILTAPALPGQEVFQTLVDLAVEERPGGFQDRSGEKDARYIHWLELDLEEYPDDPRTLYYLAYAHLNLFTREGGGGGGGGRGVVDGNLSVAIGYFERRARVEGNLEERWFAMLKLGEVSERFVKDWTRAEHWYTQAIDLDGDRADPPFYIGQHYRLSGDYEQAHRWLRQAAALERPERSLFQWEWLYTCLRFVELGEAASRWTGAEQAALTEALTLMAPAKCEGEADKQDRLRQLREDIGAKLSKMRKRAAAGAVDDRVAAVKALLSFLSKHRAEVEEVVGVDELTAHVRSMRAYVDEWKGLDEQARTGWSTCRRFRLATASYVKWWKAEGQQRTATASATHRRWTDKSQRVRELCR